MTSNEQPISDVNGDGYGSDHHWKRGMTDLFGGVKGTRYVCQRCPIVFVHHYDAVPNIFEEMEMTGVPERCEEVNK